MSPTGSSPRGPERPPPLLLSDVAQLEEHHGSQQREEEQRDRRALAQVAAVEPDLVRERREEVRHVDGPATGEHVHDIEVAEGEDGREQDDDREDRPEERQRHVPEPSPRTSAVHLGRLVELARDRDEPREHRDREEGKTAPDVDGDDRQRLARDRKSTRLNSSHLVISYAVFCLKKKKNSKRNSFAQRDSCRTT